MNEDLSKLNLVDLLELLEPVPKPPPVSMWPQTEGWIWLGVVFAACAVWLARRWIHHRWANAYRRVALKEIAEAGEDPAALAEILRRAALAGYPRAKVAGLHGEDWLAFLDRSYGETGFLDGPGRALAVAPYAPSVGATDLAPLAADWVRRHRRTVGAVP